MSTSFDPGRRTLLCGLGGLVCASVFVPRAFAAPASPAYVELHGHMKPLGFRMEDVETGKTITEAAFRGHPVILYFGFTRCPDTCPLTMQNAARLVRMLGTDGQKLRVAFVTVDIEHDTPARLKAFMAKFGKPPVFTGLRGTPAELRATTKRYGVFYQAPSAPNSPDPVSAIGHSDATYLFAPDGKAVALLTALPSSHPDLAKDAALIRKLIG